jgi:hypothetical protein
MLGYLAGAYTTGIIVGVAVVEWLHDSGVVSTTKRSLAPGIDLALGVLALLAAYAIRRGEVARFREHRDRKRGERPKKAPRWQQALSGGNARTTFLIGLVLSFPGASYLASLTEISKQDLGLAGDVLLVVAVNVVMLVLLEAPLVSFAVAPDWTPVAIERFRAWMSRSGGRALVILLTAAGTALIVRAVITFTA